MTPLALEVAGLLGALFLLAGSYSFARWSRGRRFGRLDHVDEGPKHRGRRYLSARYRLVGKPDEVRVRSDGRRIPVEWKMARAPSAGPWYSHIVQVWAYCLLLEEATGLTPPFGVLRYGDGKEFVVLWTADAREELLFLRAEVDLPYRGQARPSFGRCKGCRWHDACDVRADMVTPHPR